MNDDDLKILRSHDGPKATEDARERAVFSAMDAFDAAGLEKNVPATQGATQGSLSDNRPISTNNTMWRFLMDNIAKPLWTLKPATMATVAGTLMLPVAGLVAWNAVSHDGDRLIGEIAIEKESPAIDAADAARTNPEEKFAAQQSTKQPVAADETAQTGSELRNSQGQTADTLSRAAPEALVKIAPGTVKREITRKSARPMKAKRVISQLDTRAAPPVKPMLVPQLPTSSENYTKFDDNGVISVAAQPVSTFSIDVDTASYARVRAMLNAGNLPPKDMVRVEEMVNYFDYSYPLPETREQPFKPTVTIMPTPWNAHTKLMHIGIKGFDVPKENQPKANLVFLLDVSGSMNAPDKLPLLIKSFRLLLQKLNPTDTVSIVTYAGRAGTVLEPTQASERSKILSALENLSAGGSTAGAQGIEQAYRLAKQSFVEGGVNRVMLATDGDFNVGISDPKQLKDFIAEKRKSGIFLSVFGFGTGNYNDVLMQSLAQNGNGQAAYIDTLAEAQKTLVEEAGSTLFPIASDVKIQMEFNPAKISEYRLIGYETRALKREDFNNDKVDAGDIGAGHSVTAIYELTPVGSPAVLNDPLRYGKKEKPTDGANSDTSDEDASDEIGFLKMRYKLPGEKVSKLITTPIADSITEAEAGSNTEAGFAVAVAAFGQKLRGNAVVEDMSYTEIAEMARIAKGEDKFGYRSAFVQLVRMAGSLSK